MRRAPVLLESTLPPADDAAIRTLLGGLCRATGARGSVLALRSAGGTSATYSHGECDGARLVLQLQPGDSLHARCELFGAGAGPAASPSVLEAVRPLLESAVHALTERSNAAVQSEVLSQILGVKADASLLMCSSGEILWANEQGEEALARHTQRPQAHLDGDTQAVPLLDLVAEQIRSLLESGERSRQRVLTAWGDERWTIELMALPGLRQRGCCLVSLSPVRLPRAEDLHQRLTRQHISRRESEVLALVLEGRKASQIASSLGITEYTVKDHLKHAYAKLGITSRSQLLNRLALAPSP
ncbi:MAG: response regulator transcription factor [Thermoanaerobaculaceae bacterium]